MIYKELGYVGSKELFHCRRSLLMEPLYDNNAQCRLVYELPPEKTEYHCLSVCIALRMQTYCAWL
jgi:hypothetical protein